MVETPAPFFSRSVVNLQSLPFFRLCQDSRCTTLWGCVHPEYELGKTLEKTLRTNGVKTSRLLCSLSADSQEHSWHLPSRAFVLYEAKPCPVEYSSRKGVFLICSNEFCSRRLVFCYTQWMWPCFFFCGRKLETMFVGTQQQGMWAVELVRAWAEPLVSDLFSY